MNNFEIVILALALVFNSWNSYVNAGLVLSGEPVARKLYYSCITFMMEFLMAGTGIWAGFKTASSEVRTNILIGLSIMLLVGLKVLFTVIRAQSQENEMEYSENKRTFFAALLEGIVPLFIGISIGLLSSSPYLHWLLIGLFLLLGIITGQVAAIRKKDNAFNFKVEYMAGFLFIAAAIKLALNITGF